MCSKPGCVHVITVQETIYLDNVLCGISVKCNAEFMYFRGGLSGNVRNFFLVRVLFER